MTAQEHLNIARQLWELAHELAQRNQVVAAGEMRWGAANRIILAINLHYAIIPADRPLRRGTVIRHLDAQHQSAPALEKGLDAVGRLHGHFYSSNLLEHRLEEYTQVAETFIAALLNLPETRGIAQG